MTTINDIISTFDALKPGLAIDFVNRVNTVLNRLLEEHGARIGDLSSSWGQDGNLFRAYGYRFLVWPNRRGSEVPTINSEYLAKKAQEYADDQINAFTHKLVRKLGALTDVTIADLNIGGFTFDIYGQVAGHTVRVEQTRIINVSPKGNLFHQWPALIYVDGKKMSEAAFKKLTA